MIDKSFIVISAGRILQIGISLLAVRIFTSMLSTAEVGNLYLINSIAAFFGFTLLNPVGMYINRKLHGWVEEKNLLNGFFIYNFYLLAVSLGSVGIVYFLNHVLHVGSTIDLKLLVLFVMLNVYFNTWNQTVVQTLNLLDHRIAFVLFTVLTSFLGLALSVVLVKGTPTAIWWLAGQLAAQIALTLFAFLYLQRVLESKLGLEYVKSVATAGNFRNILCFVAPLGFTTFLMWTQTQSYRLIIEGRIGVEFLGQIGLGLSIAANIASAVESVVQQVYMPIFYREISISDHESRTAACNRMFQVAIPIYFSLTLFVSCLAPFLMTLLAHGKFGGAFLFVVYGSWIELFRMITGVLSTTAHSEMQTHYLVRAYLTGALLVVLGTYLGAGTAYFHLIIPGVLVLSGAGAMFVMYRDMKKIMRIKLGIRKIMKSAAISVPFVVALFAYPMRSSLGMSLMVTAIFGAYFLLSQYILYRQGLVATTQPQPS